MFSDYLDALKLETDCDRETIAEFLKKYEPWSHRIEFSNGLSTADFKQYMPFSDNPLAKIRFVEKKINLEDIRGGKVLDIGCYAAHNSIYCAITYDMQPVGIDIFQKRIEISQFLSKIANIKGEYLLGDAETFARPNNFDLILHFGTLYHLPNPLLSLHTSFTNLKSGGYLAIETQSYDHPEDQNYCYFMHMHNNDPTNFWALSPKVLQDYLGFIGFVDVKMHLKFTPKILEEFTPEKHLPYMCRIILTARKP